MIYLDSAATTFQKPRAVAAAMQERRSIIWPIRKGWCSP